MFPGVHRAPGEQLKGIHLAQDKLMGLWAVLVTDGDADSQMGTCPQ